MKTPIVYLFVSLFLLAAASFGDSPASPETGTRVWAPVALRGFGTLSGDQTRWQMSAGTASLLEIHCEDGGKAEIVHAKYLSDLTGIDGVKKVAGAEFPHWEVGGDRNVFTAAHAGKEVYVFQAGSVDDLQKLVRQKFATGGESFDPGTEVPMYLNRWDRFGFRFYYWTGHTPPEEKGKSYDFNQDFDFAQKTDHSGLVIWDHCNPSDTGAGIMETTDWSWAMEGARSHDLPVAINDSNGGANWVANSYRGENMMRAPGYLGGLTQIGNPASVGSGMLSWCSVNGRNAILSELQSTIRRYDGYPNLVSWLEPDGEVPLTPQCFLTDFGPTADASYRRYLKKTYGTVLAVSSRWYGNPDKISEWSQVHVPDPAYFRGGGKGCVDLTGPWKIGYEAFVNPDDSVKVRTRQQIKALQRNPVATEPAAMDWYKPDFDDSAWPQINAPGDDIGLFIQKRPAIYRRQFNMDPAVRIKNPRWWLYVWDLNRANGEPMWAYLNGTKVGESDTWVGYQAHWAAFEVTGQLKDGANQVSLRLPQGFLGYRAYLSPVQPTDYPNLGEGMNAQWVDFINWTYDAHVDVIRRGVEMIRQVDPNRQITFMHPDDMGDGLKSLAALYGAEFHCTGYMSGFFAELEPMEMRGSDLPASLEPGGPAPDLPGFKHQMGLNISEGVQGVDYFIHIGDVLWHDDIRAWFEDHCKMLHTIGRYHAPKAQVAMLIDDRSMNLTTYPWGADLNVLLGSGYWQWNVTSGLLEHFHTDAVTQSDFAAGNAAKYKVIIDSNTTIMDDALLNQIEKYVRDGGIFITYVQTGRHTPTKLNAWPIERLTGYHVTHIDEAVAHNIPEYHPIAPAPGQEVISGTGWYDLPRTDGGNRILPNGLMLEKVAPEAKNLMLWDNGKTAVGMRPLGKGYIVGVGVKFSAESIADRWDSMPHPAEITMNRLFIQLLDHFKIAHLPATLSEAYSDVMWRHYVSNNGLYDIWSLSNRSGTMSHTVGLTFEKGLNPSQCFEIKNDSVQIPITTKDGLSSIDNLTFGPDDTRLFVTPRADADAAPAEWFDLQRHWWRGTTPIRKPVPPTASKFTIPQIGDWAFHPVDAASDVAEMTGTACDDSKWERRSLGLWGIGDHPEVKSAVLRKSFTVPAGWHKGTVYFWMQGAGQTLVDGGQLYFDGKKELARNGFGDFTADGALKAGTSHVVAMEVSGSGSIVGDRFPAWISYLPDPQATLDLAGEWSRSDDYLTYNQKITLPGRWDGYVAKRTFDVDAKEKGRNVYIDFSGPVGVSGLIINGNYLGHERSWSQRRWLINVTPWIKYGQTNEIRLMGEPIPERDHPEVQGVKVDYYDQGVYP